MIEIAIRISNEEQSYVQKFLLHEEGICLSKDDPVLSKMVEETIANFHGAVDDVVVKVKFQW